jgi:hypothetical protein
MGMAGIRYGRAYFIGTAQSPSFFAFIIHILSVVGF